MKKTVKKPSKKTINLKRKGLEETNKAVIEVNGTAKEVKLQKNMFTRGKHRIKLGLFERLKLRKSPENCFIVTMRFMNGTRKTFVIKTKDSTFKMGKNMYNLIYEEAFFDLSLQQYHLDYFEGFCTPINREIVAEGSEAFFKVRPDSLKSLIGFKYIDALVRGSNVSKMQKAIIIGLIVLGVIVAYVLFGGQT